MKVFVTTSLVISPQRLAEISVVNVSDRKEKAQAVMAEVFRREFNKWPADIREDNDVIRTESRIKMTACDTLTGNSIEVEIWEKEIL